MTEARRLAGFLEETLKRDDVPGRLCKLVVAHVIGGNKIGAEIRGVTVPDSVDEDWRTATASKIVEQAATEAVTLGTGVQRYAVLAFFEGDDKARGRHVFTCAGADEEESIGTEGPDETGLVAAAMRHTEFFAQLSARGQASQIRALLDENTMLRKENAEMRAERLKSIKAIEEIYSEQHRRAIETRMATAKAKMLEEAGDKVGLLLPLAINHMAGRKVLPETSTDTLLLRSFADTISREQLEQLAGVFRGEQLAAFIKIMTTVSTPAPDAGQAQPAAAAAHANGAP